MLDYVIQQSSVPTPLVRDFSYGPNSSQRLDVYSAEQPSGRPAPLVVMLHGGVWESGSRGDVVKFITNCTSRRYVVAKIGYQVASEAMAPTATEDLRNAIECVRSRAAALDADSRRMLLAGFSAGAHLALLPALAPATAIGGPGSRARGIVSFWGITDVVDLWDDNHARSVARRWLPELPGRLALARRLSPINYDVAEAPTCCAVHSVHDNVVPLAHSERLVAKFQKAKRRVKRIKLSRQGHAAPSKDYPAIFGEIFRFLEGIGGME